MNSLPEKDCPFEGRNALVIVAHPDDEVLWSGGLMLKWPDINWTVLCMCRRSDPDRYPRFVSAMETLGVEGIILDMDDSPDLPDLHLERDAIEPILDAVGDREWDFCLTHGQNGEYGHRRHIEVHEAVVSMVESKRVFCRRLWTFAYVANDEKEMFVAQDADVVISLNDHEFKKKRELILAVYGFPENGFEAKACLPSEGFRLEIGKLSTNITGKKHVR